MPEPFRVLFFGDVVGRVGRKALANVLPQILLEHSPHVVIANGENSAGGFGIQADTANELFRAGVQLITSGNHIWGKRDVIPYLEKNKHRILRPANFPAGTPGAGSLVYEHESGVRLLLINLLGRVFMPDLVDCPFQCAEKILGEYEGAANPPLCFLDFHAEATSEKEAMGYFLDGKVSAVVGTHTHVQTADERVLPLGTAYLSDVGMCGPAEGILGCEKEPIIVKFRTGLPQRFGVDKGPAKINAVIIDIDRESRKALHIFRIFLTV